jgi:hypothetical protein
MRCVQAHEAAPLVGGLSCGAASCPSDSRRPSHAPLAYDGNMVVYAKFVPEVV